MPKSAEVTETDMIQILKEARKSHLLEKYADTMKTYQEFKELRRALGKPVITKVSPEKTKKDLSGAEFLLLIEEIQEKKGKIGTRKT